MEETHDPDGISQSVAFAVDKVNALVSTRHQLDGFGGIYRGGNAVRSRKLVQWDDTEREVLRDEGDHNRGSREERGKNGESVEDHVGE